MELVPFIYTILKIAAILAIITLIVSYISFRNKLKRETLDLPGPNPSQKNEPPAVILPVHNEELLPKLVQGKVAAKETSKPKESSKKESPEEKSTSKKTKTGHSRRVQIIKELQPVKNKKSEPKEEQQPSLKTGESLKSLDEDIISKYDEQDENDFHVLKVKNRKDKRAR